MMADKLGRAMSAESNERFLECVEALRKTQETFAKEDGDVSVALFDAIRVYMIAAAGYLERSGMKGTDEDMRAILHDLLELGIDDYQFNERIHVGSKGGS